MSNKYENKQGSLKPLDFSNINTNQEIQDNLYDTFCKTGTISSEQLLI